ncbi:MAG: hypothetical protein KKG59_06510 [Nanoarchaeota archaeon]|nr:hypothetical protein [Nanoarchaeota archaeon]
MSPNSPENPEIEGFDQLMASLSRKLEEGRVEGHDVENALDRQRAEDFNRAFTQAMNLTKTKMTNFSVPYILLGVANIATETISHAKKVYEALFPSPIIRKRVQDFLESRIRPGYAQFKDRKFWFDPLRYGVSGEELLRQWDQGGAPGILSYMLDITENVVREQFKSDYFALEEVKVQREYIEHLRQNQGKKKKFRAELAAYADQSSASIDEIVNSPEHMVPVVRRAYGTMEAYYETVEQGIEAMRHISEEFKKLGAKDITGKITMKMVRNHGHTLDDLQLKDGDAIQKVVEIPGSYVKDFAVFGSAFLETLIHIQEQRLVDYKRKGGFL